MGSLEALKDQKHLIFELLKRLQDAFPAKSLQDVFGEIVSKLDEGI
jgi:uncharacterized protein YutD